MINIFIKVQRCKIDSQKSVALIYTKDKQMEKEIMETTTITIAWILFSLSSSVSTHVLIHKVLTITALAVESSELLVFVS